MGNVRREGHRASGGFNSALNLFFDRFRVTLAVQKKYIPRQTIKHGEKSRVIGRFNGRACLKLAWNAIEGAERGSLGVWLLYPAILFKYMTRGTKFRLSSSIALDNNNGDNLQNTSLLIWGQMYDWC